MPRALAVGLTGGIASGKSLLADELARLGAPVIDGDLVAREIVRPGTPALAEIRAAFGPEFILADGTMDRRRMREHVFAKPAERFRLERITHPRIRDRLAEWRDAQTAPYCVLVVPILIETGIHALVDRILVVDAPEDVQRSRLVQRDGIDERLAGQMIAAQATRTERLTHADDVFRNDASAREIRSAAETLHRFYLELARKDQRRAPGLRLPL